MFHIGLHKYINPPKKLILHSCSLLCVYFFPGAFHHWSSSGDPMCCHKEETPEEGPAAVHGWVWYLQVCSLSQQCQASSVRHRVQVCLPNRHIRRKLWETGSRLHIRYSKTADDKMLSVLLTSWEPLLVDDHEKGRQQKFVAGLDVSGSIVPHSSMCCCVFVFQSCLSICSCLLWCVVVFYFLQLCCHVVVVIGTSGPL